MRRSSRRSDFLTRSTLLVAATAILLLGGTVALPGGSLAHPVPAAGGGPAAGGTVLPSLGGDSPVTSVSPSSVCVGGADNCSAGTGVARVSLSDRFANVTSPRVQVAFLVDTSPYTGLYDSGAGEPGSDPCAAKTPMTLCEESNGVPFLIHNSTEVASAIQAAHPNETISFALVDFFATLNNFDDGDGYPFHVDVANFTSNATQFGTEAVANFTQVAPNYVYPDGDLSDNLLHSSSITALYGSMVTRALHWSNNTHHVLVWVGVTAPRDPYYTQNYSVSPSIYATYYSGAAAMSSGCEPSYNYSTGVSSPWCVGWVNDSSPNSTTSIAALAKTSSNCRSSVGEVCTIDAIDLWSTPTDAYSKGWPAGRYGGGPGGSIVKQNTQRVLDAGCAIANATGGSWDGPSFFACPGGTNGTLHLTGGGPYNFSNPTLLDALANISLGYYGNAAHPIPGRPLFTFVPDAPVALASPLDATVGCRTPTGPFTGCGAATLVDVGGVEELTWNWSLPGDPIPSGAEWNASFNVIVRGPPLASWVPIDVCSTSGCLAAEGSVPGPTSEVAYVATNGSVADTSFPLTLLSVAGPNPLTVQLNATPAAPTFGEPVLFQAQAFGGWGATSFRWTFSDGSVASGADVTHAFDRPGSFVAQVEVGDAVGQWTNASLALAVGDVPLALQLTIAPGATTVGRPVSLNGTVTGGSAPLTYVWSDLPAGCYGGASANLTCTVWQSGRFSIGLQATDPFGETTRASIDLVVDPALSITLSDHPQSSACGASTVPVSFTSTIAGGTPGYTYRWNLGGVGGTASGATAQADYAPRSSHVVSVEVLDSAGASANASVSVLTPSVPTCSVPSSFDLGIFGTSVTWIAVGLGVLAGMGIVLVLTRRPSRRRPPGPSGARVTSRGKAQSGPTDRSPRAPTR